MNHARLLLMALLAAFCACQHQQPGLNEYREALALMEQGDAPAALQQLQRVVELAHSDSLLALAYSQMGTLYFDQRLLDRSLDSYRKAYETDRRARDTLGLIYDLRDMGNVMRATDDRQDSCLYYFHQARCLAMASDNTAMLRDVESQLAGYHLYHNQLDEARRLLLPATLLMDSTNQSGLLFLMADLYHRSGQKDSATYCYRRLLAVGNLYGQQAAHRALAEYCMAEGRTDEAMSHLRQYEALTDSVYRANDAEAVRRTSALYDYTLHQQQAHRLGQRLTLAVSILLLLVLLLIVGMLFFSRRRLHYRLKVERLEQLLEKYREQDRQAIEQQQTEITATPIYCQIDRFLNDAHQQAMGDDDFHLLADTVEQQWPGFLARLQEFCHLTPQERRVCLLLKIGLPPAAIAQLTAHTKQSVTNTRARLFKKAFDRKGTPAEWDEFVQSL